MTQTTAPATSESASALLAAASRLWPPPCQVRIVRRALPLRADEFLVAEHALLPSAARPRLVVPTASRAAGAAIVGRTSADTSARMRAARRVTSSLVRVGATRTARERIRITAIRGREVDSIERHLSALLGTDVVVGLFVGPPRANRKPILHVVRPDGETVAFVKVGDSPLTRTLVAGEAQSLATVATAGLQLIEVPRVLALDTWRDLDLLVLEPVGVGARPRAAERLVHAAMRELALSGSERVSLTQSTLASSLRSAAAELSDRATGDRFAAAVERLLAAATGVDVTVGAWHGDWTPWNMASFGNRVALWDWERFAVDVPAGFDALHFALQADLRRHDASDHTRTRFMRSRQSLVTAGGGDADSATVVAAAYLAELARRYHQLVAAPTGAPLVPLANWVADLLDAAVAEL
jgi:hypothetical protein